MTNTPETPRIITDVIDSAEKRQTLQLGESDLAELADKSDKVKEEMDAKLTSREALQALKQTITTGVTAPENKSVVEDPVSMANLQRLEQQIDVAIATKPEAGSTEHKVLVAGKSVGSILTKLSTSFGNILGTMGSSTTLFFASIMESFGYKSAAEWLRGYAEPGVIRDAMAEKLKKPIDKTPDDAGHAKTLRAQYQAKIDAEKKDPKTYSFETFVAQKIDELRATERDSYVLADLTSITSPEAKAVDEAKEKERNDKKKQEDADKEAKEAADKIKEGLEKDPNLTYVQIFRDALKKTVPTSIDGAVEGETLNDVTQQIIASFRTKGKTAFGLELDGGTLEETRESGWNDWNVIEGWENTLRSDPVAAIKEFLRIDPEQWKLNPKAAATFRDVRTYMAEHGIAEDRLTSGKGPATAPAPAPAVAGDSSSTGIGIMM
jgi:hypothetical protein